MPCEPSWQRIGRFSNASTSRFVGKNWLRRPGPTLRKVSFWLGSSRCNTKPTVKTTLARSLILSNKRGGPAGRIYLFCTGTDIRIIDISLLPERRGGGLGTALLTAVITEATASGHSVSIHVEHFNPARRLYERLGFREISRGERSTP